MKHLVYIQYIYSIYYATRPNYALGICCDLHMHSACCISSLNDIRKRMPEKQLKARYIVKLLLVNIQIQYIYKFLLYIHMYRPLWI